MISRYGHMTGRELEILSHGEEPWRQADKGRLRGQSAPIPIESIRDYFVASELADREEDPVPLDSATVRQLLAGARERRTVPDQPDRREDILARVARG
ncbi:MAG: hypothetical protein J2P15_10975 [Micromonosporaceae bacterium]|nr:hypothetical protein [Micromonosporaceae bacterium]